MRWEYVLSVEGCCFFCIDLLSTRDKMRHLGAVVVSDCEDRIESLRLWEFHDEVQCNCLEREYFQCWVDWAQHCSCGTIIYFMVLALSTPLDIVRDFLL